MFKNKQVSKKKASKAIFLSSVVNAMLSELKLKLSRLNFLLLLLIALFAIKQGESVIMLSTEKCNLHKDIKRLNEENRNNREIFDYQNGNSLCSRHHCVNSAR